MANEIPRNHTDSDRHSTAKSIILHLLPGLLVLLFFIVTAPLLKNYGLPSIIPLLFALMFILIPFELGYLLYQAKKKNGSYSMQNIIHYREKIPTRQYWVLVPILLFWAIIGFAVISAPIDNYLLKTLFSWLPDWFFAWSFINNVGQYSKPVLLIVMIIGVVLNSVIGPIVEELYFRGHLLPRLPRFKGWAPLINVSLFSLYHFFTPWQNPGRMLALIPMVYAVWWKRNIYLGIWVHCLMNTAASITMVIIVLKRI